MSYLVGGRDAEYAMWFMDDLRERLANRVQLTSDGHKAYLQAVEGAFGDDIDYAQLVEMYGPTVLAHAIRRLPGAILPRPAPTPMSQIAPAARSPHTPHASLA